MENSNEEVMEPRPQRAGGNESNRTQRKTGPRPQEERNMTDKQPMNNAGPVKKTQKKFQHPGELPRSQPSTNAQAAARRAYESRIGADERMQQKSRQHEGERSSENSIGDDPEEFYRTAPPVPPKTRSKTQQQQQQQTRRSSNDGRESVQSRRTSNQGEKGHQRQKSQAEIDEFYSSLAQPKHIVTPRKARQYSRPKTDRELVRSHIYRGSAGTRSRAVELPFNDRWSKSKIEREEDFQMIDEPTDRQMRNGHDEMHGHENDPIMDGRVMDGQGRMHGNMHGLPGTYVEEGGEVQGGGGSYYGGFASLLGFDNRRQNQMEMEIMSLRKRLWHSQKKNEELNYNLSELSHANDGLQGDLRRVQQKTFGQMSKSVWTPLEDRAIQETLEEIHHDLEEWADDNCKGTLVEVLENLSEEQKSELFELCAKVADVTQPDLGSQFQWWEARDLDPVLLLTALVTFRMYDCVFNNHFLALGAIDQAHMEMMSDLYLELANLDFKQAQVWRSQLMRILVGTPTSGGRFDGVNSKLEISTFIKRFCDDILDEFKNYPEFAFLKGPMTDESRQSLLGCWSKIGELFIQLQTQVAALQWKATGCLRSSVNPRFIESHRSQAFPKGRNDGKPISLIISPMITFFGNEDGERYEDWRAICKATVLVIDEEIEASSSDEEEEEEEVADEDAMEEDTPEIIPQKTVKPSHEQERLVDDGEIL